MRPGSKYIGWLIAYFQRRGKVSATSIPRSLLSRPSRQDVLDAFRFILGREIDDSEAVNEHMQFETVADLRQVLLNSEEFIAKSKKMHPDVQDHPYLTAKRRTVVFVHLQKTGGTSLRKAIGQEFPFDKRCPILENKLHLLSLAELAQYDFFAGHFDLPSIKLIPRDDVLTISMFREPSSRLVSLYRFLRSHPNGDEFADDRLVQLAHAHTAEEFFALDEIRSYSAINNHYLFALGRSFHWFDENQRTLTENALASALLDAKLQVSALSGVGITERFDESVRLISEALNITPHANVRKMHVTDQFPDRDSRFRRTDPVMMTPELAAAMRDLVFYDKQVYEFAAAEFERRLAIASKNPAQMA